MRKWIDLFEKSEIWPLPRGQIRLERSPTLSRLNSMLTQHEELRGGLTRDGVFYIWNAYQASHDVVTDALGGEAQHRFQIKFFFSQSLDDLEANNDWSMGAVWEFKGGFFLTDYGCDPAHLVGTSLKNALKIGSLMGSNADQPGLTLNANYQRV